MRKACAIIGTNRVNGAFIGTHVQEHTGLLLHTPVIIFLVVNQVFLFKFLWGNAQVIRAKVPLSEMFGYVTQLRSLSSGRATSTMEFSHYAPAPNNVAEEVIAKVKGKANA
jgi:translation elongation factor EF-G